MNQDPLNPGSQNGNTTNMDNVLAAGSAPVNSASSTAQPGMMGRAAQTPDPGMATNPSMGNTTSMAGPGVAPNFGTMPANQPILSDNPGGSVVMPAGGKKKHTGLIVAIVTVLLVLLAGGGFSLWYFLLYSNPENVAFDAINGFLQEKNITLGGSMWGESYDYDDTGMRMELALQNSSDGLAGSSDISYKMMMIDEEHEEIKGETLELLLGSVMMSDGVFYLKVGKLMDYLNKSYPDMSEATDQDSQVMYQLLETFSDEWWEVSVPDVVDMVADLVDDAKFTRQAEYTKQFYSCLVNAAQQNIKGEIAEIYKNNRFVRVQKVDRSAEGHKVAEGGHSLYLLSFDYAKMASFVNELPKTATANSIYACYNDYAKHLDDYSTTLPESVSADDIPEVTADDLEEDFGEADNKIYLEISNWGHQLRSVFVHNEVYSRSYSGSDYAHDEVRAQGKERLESIAELNLIFSYSPVTIAAPAESRPITDLFEEMMEVVTTIVNDNSDSDWEYDPETDTIYEYDGWEDDWGDQPQGEEV